MYIPNRTITNVINYPRGYVRAYLDVRLPDARGEEAEDTVRELVAAIHERFPGLLLLPPTVEGAHRDGAGIGHLRVKFRIWPGQGALLETYVRQTLAASLRRYDERYADWMIAAHYRAEPSSGEPRKALPRPAALRRRTVT